MKKMTHKKSLIWTYEEKNWNKFLTCEKKLKNWNVLVSLEDKDNVQFDDMKRLQHGIG
jgi:hypothetical protein